MDQTLVLNASYEPLRVVSWQKAITMLFQGKVEVIAVYDREIRGVTVRVQLPSVLRLLRHVRMKRTFTDVPFSRANVYGRDDHRCQYISFPRKRGCACCGAHGARPRSRT
jgi:5-methylcytosine-specific restriction endonuclease McrA